MRRSEGSFGYGESTPVTLVYGVAPLAIRRPHQRSSTPFVTRRSTLAFSALCVVAGLAFQALAGPASANALLVATTGALVLVSGTVAWVEGIVLAVRAGSVLWIVIAFVPLVPLSAVMCAMFCPAAGEQKR